MTIFVSAPLHPTDRMMEAAGSVMVTVNGNPVGLLYGDIVNIYRTMLESAPTPTVEDTQRPKNDPTGNSPLTGCL